MSATFIILALVYLNHHHPLDREYLYRVLEMMIPYNPSIHQPPSSYSNDALLDNRIGIVLPLCQLEARNRLAGRHGR